MNYQWKKIVERGQYETGFVDVFNAVINEKKAYTIINYLPEFEDKAQKAVVTFLLEGQKSNWTERQVKDIFYDCEDIVKRDVSTKFKVFNNLENIITQTFCIKEIDQFDFVTNGDWSFI